MTEQTEPLIGQNIPAPRSFADIDQIFTELDSPKFREKSSIERNKIVNKTLTDLIMKAPRGSFLLREICDYLERMTKSSLLDGHYNLSAYERWLNQHSGLSYEENRLIRGKIVGRYIPRDEYQQLFPIGGDRIHPNCHTVTAHNPPDLDSTTASFVGWLDAFACRVGSSLHIWNVPQGEPGELISKLFNDIFGKPLFQRVAKDKTMISPTAMELVRQDRLIRVSGETSIRDFQHNRHENHIMLVNGDGYYIGDWRVTDVDSVGRVQRLLNICVNSYEKRLVTDLSALLASSPLRRQDFTALSEALLLRRISEFGGQLQRYSGDEMQLLDKYLRVVLGVESGCNAHMADFFVVMDRRAGSNFASFVENFNIFIAPESWNAEGGLALSPERLFQAFNATYTALSESTGRYRSYCDRLDVAMAVKRDVLGHRPNYVSTKSDIAEIQDKIKDYQHVAVCFADSAARLVPVGVIHRDDLEEPVQGTLSLRDFLNHDEIKIASTVAVISAIDHHKSTMHSKQCMTITIADVQSANVLVAERSFYLNDLYSTRGQSKDSIEAQIRDLAVAGGDEPSQLRLLERLTRKRLALSRAGNSFFVSPEREFTEYLLLFNAIVDDTDLFQKCGWRDLDCVCQLINRMKSILLGREVEILDVSHYPRVGKYLRQAIRDILVDPDAYSFYRAIFSHRQGVMDRWMLVPEQLVCCFEDRKIQNEFCAVSQHKLFPGNREVFTQRRAEILAFWLELSSDLRRKNGSVDFFLHMTSTIPGADEAYLGRMPDTSEEDEIWITVDQSSDQGLARLRHFLSMVKSSTKYNSVRLRSTIEGRPGAQRDAMVANFHQALPAHNLSISDSPYQRPVLVFRFIQGSMNSRKADVTPYLPS